MSFSVELQLLEVSIGSEEVAGVLRLSRSQFLVDAFRLLFGEELAVLEQLLDDGLLNFLDGARRAAVLARHALLRHVLVEECVHRRVQVEHVHQLLLHERLHHRQHFVHERDGVDEMQSGQPDWQRFLRGWKVG